MSSDAYRASTIRVAPVVYLKRRRAIALDRDKGEELWVFEAAAIVTRILLAHGSVYLGDAEGWVYCLEPATGNLRGKIQTGGGSVSALIDDGDRILVAAEGGVFALTPSGDLIWAFDSRHHPPSVLAEVGLACTMGFAQQPDLK